MLTSGCSPDPGPEPVRALDEIPQHIREVDSLTVYPADSEPLYTLELVSRQSFGGSGRPHWKVITGCEVDDNGRVIMRGLTTEFKTELHAYNPDGTYRGQIGRYGSGPGEYQFVSPNFQIEAGQVFLYDEFAERLSMFTTEDYAFKKTTRLQDWNVRDLETVRNMELGGFYARSDGNLLAIFQAPPAGSGRTANTKLMPVDTDGNVLTPKPVLELPSPFYIVGDNQGHGNNMLQSSIRIPLPFMGLSLVALTGVDEMYTARTDEFLIKKYDSKGTYVFAFYYPVKGPPFDMESFVKREAGPLPRNAFKKVLEEADMEIPKSFSVIKDLIVDDDNRNWVSVVVDYPDTNEWWVLGESGELHAKMVPPENEVICDIQNGYLYTRFFNGSGDGEESFDSKVVKYSINLIER